MTQPHELEPIFPEGMIEISSPEFYSILKADPRDIMPMGNDRMFTHWRVVRTGELWGYSWPGYANGYGPGSGTPHPKRHATYPKHLELIQQKA